MKEWRKLAVMTQEQGAGAVVGCCQCRWLSAATALLWARPWWVLE